MKLSRLASRAAYGVTAYQVTVETHLSNGLPSFVIVGLPQAAVRESRERVRSALVNSGYDFPAGRITVNLAPAELPKSGGRYDLAIALGILAAMGQVPMEAVKGHEFYGELALCGGLRHTSGLLPSVVCAQRSRHLCILPRSSRRELLRLSPSGLYFARTLKEVVAFLNGEGALDELLPDSEAVASDTGGKNVSEVGLATVRGQLLARRGLEIAAAGGHHLLMYGPPGCGKSLLARCLPGILPALGQDQATEVAALYSVHGRAREPELWHSAPFRSPHHQLTVAGLLGGGVVPQPGELSLAHHGVLFLDELVEFRGEVLESLRQPLEMAEVHISRAHGRICFPARTQLVAAMNPCPCGYWGGEDGRCQCTPGQRQRYLGRLSGPLLDRFDLRVSMEPVPADEWFAEDRPESSEDVGSRVARARQVQAERQGSLNRDLSGGELARHAVLSDTLQPVFQQAVHRLRLSARSCDRVLRVARTIADLSGSPFITRSHLLEALGFRVSPAAEGVGA